MNTGQLIELITKLKLLNKERQEHIYLMAQCALLIEKHKSKDQV